MRTQDAKRPLRILIAIVMFCLVQPVVWAQTNTEILESRPAGTDRSLTPPNSSAEASKPTPSAMAGANAKNTPASSASTLNNGPKVILRPVIKPPTPSQNRVSIKPRP